MRIIYLSLFLSLFTFNAFAQSNRDAIATLDSAEGRVEGLFHGAKDFVAVNVGQVFKQGETVRTFAGTKAALVFSSGVLLRLAPGTSLTFQDVAAGKQNLSMQSGKGYFFSREPAQFPVISSPAVTTAVRGTEFVIEVADKHTSVSVISGAVQCSNSYGAVELGKGERADTVLGQAPVKSLLLRPEDAVQWVVSFPEVLDLKALGAPAAAAYSGVRGLLNAGALLDASDKLKQIESQKGVTPQEAVSFKAQRAVIELALNHTVAADSLVSEALAQEPSSVPGLMAASYVAQGQRNLTKSRERLEQAYHLSANDARVGLRLAELQIAFGSYARASDLIGAALAHDPANPYALSLRGFLRLIKHDTDSARADFEAALKLAPASALAHLGSGLSHIRDGDLETGRAELSKAAALEPLSSIYRSYLGKAFFEEYRDHLAQSEYDQAINLDPLDPTPYLYRAYSNLSENRVVSALEDVEKSIELNHNRAVYRSSMLLDQDLGVRSASLSEVFSALGFAQAARIEAIKSINRDYGNFSAHQLLANSYNTIFLDQAGQSERQISSLLAPLSFNLFSSGTAAPSLNEYTSLFDRDQQRTRIALDGSTQDDFLNPSVSTAGKDGDLGYFLGLNAINTDGTTHRNYEHRYSAEAIGQYEIDSDNRLVLQGEGLYRRRVDDNQAAQDVRFESYGASLGYRSQLAPQLSLLAETRYGNDHNRFISPQSERFVNLLIDIEGEQYGAEEAALLDELTRESVRSSRNTVQLIYDSDLVSTVWGAQAYFARADRGEDSAVLADELGILQDTGFSVLTQGNNNLDSFDTYIYSTLHASPYADLTGGFSFNDLEIEDREITPFLDSTQHDSQVSPKLGLSVYPAADLTLRAAYFESLRKSSLENLESLEPTLVGGMNQVFNDLSGSRSRNWAGGIDYKLPSSTYLGAEAVFRHVIDRNAAAGTFVNLNSDGYPVDAFAQLDGRYDLHNDQEIYRAYLYQVWCARLVSTVDYEFYNAERTDPDLPQDYDLSKIVTALRYFDPSGFFGFVSGTWREQNRKHSDVFGDGIDSFWIADAGIGYRLAERSGSVTLEVNNIFDKSFAYDQIFGFEEFLRDDIGVAVKANFSF